jgi:hypothetical protein
MASGSMNVNSVIASSPNLAKDIPGAFLVASPLRTIFPIAAWLQGDRCNSLQSRRTQLRSRLY